MTKTVYYVYLGTNGTITSPIHLEDIYYTRKISLRADKGMVLTKNGKDTFTSVMVPEGEVDQSKEIKAGQK